MDRSQSNRPSCPPAAARPGLRRVARSLPLLPLALVLAPAHAEPVYLCRDSQGGALIADQPQPRLHCEAVTTPAPTISSSGSPGSALGGAAATPVVSLLPTADRLPDAHQAANAGPVLASSDIAALAQASQQRRSDYQDMLRRAAVANATASGHGPASSQ